MKIGDMLYIKTTEEPVIVLSVDDKSITVRRPLGGRDGTSYVKDNFMPFELETIEEKDARIVADLKRRHLMSQAASKEVESQLALSFPADPSSFRN